MKTHALSLLFALLSVATMAQNAPTGHPDTSKPGWKPLFAANLSNASYPKGIWSVTDGVLTATEDKTIWTNVPYESFELDLEFKTAPGTNSGVVAYCSDTANWIPNSIEIQIADDYAKQWADSPKNWQCGAFFGHKGATKQAVKKPGEWNRYTITARGRKLYVVLNGALVNEMNMDDYTSVERNPDGSEVPKWLNKPVASLPSKGFIGLQGKHAGAPIYFRNLKIRAL